MTINPKNIRMSALSEKPKGSGPGPKTFGCKYHMQNSGQVCIISGFLEQTLLIERDVSLLAVDARMEKQVKKMSLENTELTLLKYHPLS